MKCLKCGAELTEDTKFCSYCGAKVETEKRFNDTTEDVDFEGIHYDESISSQPGEDTTKKLKNKFLKIWNNLSNFGKLATIGITMFTILALVAFLAGRIVAGIFSIVQIVIAVVAILMKKDIIKVPKSWMPFAIMFLSFVLLIPYFGLFKINSADYVKYSWNEVNLAEMLPEPESPYGEIISNSDEYLSLNVTKTSEKQYNNYIEACKDKGFTIDTETTGSFFYAFNDKGYKLSLSYYEGDMHINLDAAMKLGSLTWSDSEIAKLLPVPKSTVGSIEKDDEKGFAAYIGETTIDDFNAYVKSCEEKGFSIEANKTDKQFTAKNKESYKLVVEYKGNNVIYISIAEPEFNINVEIECIENIVFSKYDVDVYIDDELEGTIPHGDKETYAVVLTKGKHTISFISAEDDTLDGEVEVEISKEETLKFEISCSSTGIDVETIQGTSESIENNDTGDKETDSATSDEKDTKDITVTMSEDDFIGMLYTDAEDKLREMGFTKFEYETLETEDVNNPDDTVGAVEIKTWEFGKGDFEIGDTYGTDAIVVLWYYVCDEPEPNLTVDNCSELAEMLKNKAEIDDSYSDFATKYKGKIIEFDGRIDYCAKHEDYNTRFDYLVSAGDYDPDHQIGPTFKFEDVSYYDLNTNIDTVSVGLNVHIVAEVVSFDSNSGLFYLEPVSITGR